MSYTHGTHFLKDYQKALSVLPEGTAVFVVSGCGNRPREVEALFLNLHAATLWIATRPDPLDYKTNDFTLVRERHSDLSLLQPGAPPMHAIDGLLRKAKKLAPLPHDRFFDQVQWISIKERLPENKKMFTPYHYLISIQGKDVQEAAWAESCASTKDHPDWDFFDVHHHGERISRSWITHWMALPAPAKEDK